MGSLFSGSVTYLLTNMYIDNYYILIPKNILTNYIESYKKYE
jgi:hypothetical protein